MRKWWHSPVEVVTHIAFLPVLIVGLVVVGAKLALDCTLDILRETFYNGEK